MKFNPIMALFALLLGGLICYCFYLAIEDTAKVIISGAFTAISLFSVMAISFRDSSRMSIMFKTAAGIFFVAILIANICMACFNAGIEVLVILNGVLFVIDLIVLYGVVRAAAGDRD